MISILIVGICLFASHSWSWRILPNAPIAITHPFPFFYHNSAYQYMYDPNSGQAAKQITDFYQNPVSSMKHSSEAKPEKLETMDNDAEASTASVDSTTSLNTDAPPSTDDDSGVYKHDNSGDYSPDNSGDYAPDSSGDYTPEAKESNDIAAVPKSIDVPHTEHVDKTALDVHTGQPITPGGFHNNFYPFGWIPANIPWFYYT